MQMLEQRNHHQSLYFSGRPLFTWVDLQWMIPLQGEDQREGSCAENLSRGKVHAVVHLEVKAT